FFGVEVKIERRWSIAGPGGDRPQRSTIQTFGFKHAPGGIQNQPALELAYGLLASSSRLDRHAILVAQLTFSLLGSNRVRIIDQYCDRRRTMTVNVEKSGKV